MLARLARFSYRRKYLMIFGIWVPLLVGLNIVGGAVGTDFRTEFSQPDSESTKVGDAFKAARSGDDGFPAQIVFTAEQGTADPEVQAAMEVLFEQVDALRLTAADEVLTAEEVAALPAAEQEKLTDPVKVVSPFSEAGSRQTSPAGSPTNSTGKDVSFAQLTVTRLDQATTQTLAEEIRLLGADIDIPGLQVEYGGQVFQEFEFPASELLGILAAIVILMIAFGSVIAMGLPIGTATVGLGVATAIVGLTSRGLAIPEFGPQMAAMIGLGVGIDYALFIVSRYREHLLMGEDPETATVAALDTSGRAVIFAGITVMISLLGLFIMGLSFVQGLAVSGATAVLVMMIASVTLLPALLGMVGTRINTTTRGAAAAVGLFVLCGLIGVVTDKPLMFLLTGLLIVALIMEWQYNFIGRIIGRIFGTRFGAPNWPGSAALRTPLPERKEKAREHRFWFRWSRMVQHRPWPAFIAGAGVLVAMSIPLFGIRLGFSDEGNQPTHTTVRKAYDLIADSFGPGTNGPLYLVSTDPAATAESVAAVDAALTELQGTSIAIATPGVEIAPGTWSWIIYPTTAPQDEATSDLVHQLRDDVLPASGIEVWVGGWTAGGIDFSSYIAGRLPYLIGAVLILSFLLLMMVFRSVLVPVKAVVMNLLSVGAAYGFIVAVFQWGWGASLIGVDHPGPVEAWAPMMLFAIVFGLSMDYEVFLLSRMKEEFDRTGDNATAVADGLASTARVITAAAIIMVCVFSAFALGDDRSLKLFGLGMAVAVFVDATVVRMVLVPATMELLGARNWWIPKWLDRILPHINVEASHDHHEHDNA